MYSLAERYTDISPCAKCAALNVGFVLGNSPLSARAMHEITQEQIDTCKSVLQETQKICGDDVNGALEAEVFRVLLSCHQGNKQFRENAEMQARLQDMQKGNLGAGGYINQAPMGPGRPYSPV